MGMTDIMPISITDKKKYIRPNLLNIFPRSMGTPANRMIVYNSKERDEYIREWGQTHPIYISVYAFKKVIEGDLYKTHQHAKVSHIVGDFDEGNTYEEMMRMHKWLMERDYIHRIHLSGRGFHIYLWIKENLKHPKIAISNFFDFLHGDRNGKYSNPFNKHKKYTCPKFTLDPATRGDLGRIIRYPNSYHYKVRCFCIVVDKHLMETLHSVKEFQDYAQRPYKPKSSIYFGTKKLDIKEFDCTDLQYKDLGSANLKLSYIAFGDMKINDDVDVDLEDLPYCIKYMIEKEEMHFPQRNEIIKFFFNRVDTLIPYDCADVMGILFKIAKKNAWIRWFFRHHREDILYRNVRVVNDNIEVLSGCRKIQKMGYCDRISCQWKSIIEKE